MAHDPHSFSDPSQGRITHLTLRIRPDFGSRSLHIQAHYALDRPVHGSFFLDGRDLGLARVYTEDGDIPWSVDRQDDILGQRVHLHDLRGARGFSIDLATGPKAKALQWLEPAQTAGGVHPFLYTQCQSIHAAESDPVPGFAVRPFHLRGRDRNAESADRRHGRRSAGCHAGETASNVFRFAMPQPIPSYLLGFAVGHLAFQSLGPRTGIYAEPELLEAAAWEFADNEAAAWPKPRSSSARTCGTAMTS